MKWSRDLPTQHGVYWAWHKDIDPRLSEWEFVLVQISNHYDGGLGVDTFGSEVPSTLSEYAEDEEILWFGPIGPPSTGNSADIKHATEDKVP